MKGPRKPVQKVSIDEAGSEKLSYEMNDAADKVQLSIHIGTRLWPIRPLRAGQSVRARRPPGEIARTQLPQ